MTTIAWDGYMLAGDTLALYSGAQRGVFHKIYQLEENSTGQKRLYGGSGLLEDILAVRDWLNRLCIGDEKPVIDPNDGFAAIVVLGREMVYRFGPKLIPIPVSEPWHAIGSGGEYALTAMFLGKTAKEAVEIAARFDVSTGGTIDTLTLE